MTGRRSQPREGDRVTPATRQLMADVRRTQARDTRGPASSAHLARRRDALPNEGEILGGHYRLVRRLGEGMFGRVFVAERTDVREHRVALKVMSREVYGDRDVERELTMLAAASHPHIVQLKDHGITADLVWLTMPLYEGETLAQRLERGPLGLREAYDIFVPVTRGVQALHERGLRHQDVKPENIFLARFSDRTYPVLLDLGVAVEKSSEFVAGTILYCSPEQLMALGGLGSSAALSERMDTYCLATTLLRALCGEPDEARRPPSTPLEIANWFERREEDPLPEDALPDLTGKPREALVEALRHWLRREPGERASAREMAEGLDVLLEQEREAALAIERAIARQKVALQRVSGALVALGVLAAAAGFYTFSKRETLRLAGELERVRAEGAASFDKLDTCVASHEIERRKAERCNDERRDSEAEHTRTLASIAHGSESALQAVEKKNETLRGRLRFCQDRAEENSAAWAGEKSDLEALWRGRSDAWDTERGKLRDEREGLRRERDDLEKSHADVKRERDDARRERDDVKRDRDELKRERDDVKRERDDVQRERDDLRKAKATCDTALTDATEARERCKSELTSCHAERARAVKPEPRHDDDAPSPSKGEPPKEEPSAEAPPEKTAAAPPP